MGVIPPSCGCSERKLEREGYVLSSWAYRLPRFKVLLLTVSCLTTLSGTTRIYIEFDLVGFAVFLVKSSFSLRSDDNAVRLL